jgi:hypothetical protein
MERGTRSEACEVLHCHRVRVKDDETHLRKEYWLGGRRAENIRSHQATSTISIYITYQRRTGLIFLCSSHGRSEIK